MIRAGRQARSRAPRSMFQMRRIISTAWESAVLLKPGSYYYRPVRLLPPPAGLPADPVPCWICSPCCTAPPWSGATVSLAGPESVRCWPCEIPRGPFREHPTGHPEIRQISRSGRTVRYLRFRMNQPELPSPLRLQRPVQSRGAAGFSKPRSDWHRTAARAGISIMRHLPAWFITESAST